MDTLKQFIPYKTIIVRPRDKPWITSDIKQSLRKRNRLFKRFKRTQEPIHFFIYKAAQQEARTIKGQGP
jgi:hypothetical protein